MITAGIDIGSLYTKAVILKDGALASYHVMKTGESSREAAETALSAAAAAAGIERERIEKILATGVGKDEADIADDHATEVMAVARGAVFMHPGARGAIDAGGESTRVMRIDGSGNLVDFALNDKCAAGTGIFLDEMGKLMGVRVEDMGAMSLKSTAEVNITSLCVVFAESEVVSQVHRQTPKVDIIKGIHKSIATRIYGMVNRIGIGENSVMVGGLARNTGIVSLIEDMMNVRLVLPENPHLAGAIGAAMIAAREGGNR